MRNIPGRRTGNIEIVPRNHKVFVIICAKFILQFGGNKSYCFVPAACVSPAFIKEYNMHWEKPIPTYLKNGCFMRIYRLK